MIVVYKEEEVMLIQFISARGMEKTLTVWRLKVMQKLVSGCEFIDHLSPSLQKCGRC